MKFLQSAQVRSRIYGKGEGGGGGGGGKGARSNSRKGGGIV